MVLVTIFILALPLSPWKTDKVIFPTHPVNLRSDLEYGKRPAQSFVILFGERSSAFLPTVCFHNYV